MTIEVREAEEKDREIWLSMRRALWPDCAESEQVDEAAAYFAGTPIRTPWQVLLAFNADGKPLGFVELSRVSIEAQFSAAPASP